MAFLRDIVGKRISKLDFRKKGVGFVEDRASLRVKKMRRKKFDKKEPQEIWLNRSNLFVRLLPRKLRDSKIWDIQPARRMKGLLALYRFTKISPKKRIVEKEVWRFGVIGLVAVVLLNLVGAFTQAMILQKQVKVKALGAYDNLLSAADAAKQQDFMGMFEGFYGTTQLLEEVENDLRSELHYQVSSGIDSPLQEVTLVLRAGRHLSKAGEHMSKIIYSLKELPSDFMEENNETVAGMQPDLKITDKIKADSGYLNLAMTEIEAAIEILEEVEMQYLPEKYQDDFENLEEKLKEGQKLIALLQEYIPYVLDLLGDRYPQRYMILLQNNHESRATGGFIGSYILMDLNDGEITKFELKDVYEADGQYYEKVTPPEGLHKITDNWRMRDANYSPDFPTSARQVMWFLEQEKGPTVDTVIAINQRVVESLLEKIGEVQMPGMDLQVSADNFSWIFSFLIEAKFSESDSPKQFLMDFAPVFKDELLKPQNIPVILDVLQTSILRKDVMAYSEDEETTLLIERLGIAGAVVEVGEEFDYLQVVNTSIGGNKSDGFVSQKIEHETEVSEEGTVGNELTITRKHLWYHEEDALFDELYNRFGSGKLERQELKDVIGFGGNKSLIRVYVPLGSEFVSATGAVVSEDVMVYEQLGKTVFAFEQPVIYTEREVKLKINYVLPYQLDLKKADTYRLVVQNQPGQEENYFVKTVKTQEKSEVLNLYPDEMSREGKQMAVWDKFLEGDEYLAVLLGGD